mgnify:CR=1 FL=1
MNRMRGFARWQRVEFYHFNAFILRNCRIICNKAANIHIKGIPNVLAGFIKTSAPCVASRQCGNISVKCFLFVWLYYNAIRIGFHNAVMISQARRDFNFPYIPWYVLDEKFFETQKLRAYMKRYFTAGNRRSKRGRQFFRCLQNLYTNNFTFLVVIENNAVLHFVAFCISRFIKTNVECIFRFVIVEPHRYFFILLVRKAVIISLCVVCVLYITTRRYVLECLRIFLMARNRCEDCFMVASGLRSVLTISDSERFLSCNCCRA